MMRLLSAARFSFILFAMAVCGCAAPSASPFRGLPPEQARALAGRMAAARERELDADLREAFATRSPRNVLVLSGGDQDGAFGSGFLKGWRRAPGGRPAFDVVTGVSTGALMATFAFLGEERDDAALRAVYTGTNAGDVFRVIAPGSFDAVLDTAPLRQLIARYVTADVVRRVAAQHQRGRRLYVATFDLDANQLVIWPLSKMAAEGGDKCLNRYRAVLLASASVPVFFPPVTIDGDLHVDAGLREVLFLRAAMLGIGKAYDARPPADRAAGPPVVYVIVNGGLHAAPEAVPDGIAAIGMRSLALYTESQQLFNLREAAHVALCHQPAFGFNFVAEPDSLNDADDQGVMMAFDSKRMLRVYAAGEALGASPMPWQRGLPPLDGDPKTSTAAAGRSD
ncbi:MAG: hypothetical protein JWP03_1568 [Phycisphaerales bacterium]|nr:hypothetical protein [Phycisphaerales bacterium]